MDAPKLDAPAKINWRLAVTGRREDGYHLLSGLMQSISLSDTVYLRASAADSCDTEPPLPGLAEDNLAFQAWLLLKRQLGLKQCLQIRIEKRIPVSGGLGGGSADAAAVLRGANRLFELGLTLSELSALSLTLGADIPFCLWGGLAKAEGVGEKLTPLAAPPPLHLLLVNPGFAVPTARVFSYYRNSGQPFSEACVEEKATVTLARALERGDIAGINSLLANDLAHSARMLYPEISLLEQQLRDTGLTPLLSGSGGTVFALIENAEAAEEARRQLAGLPWVKIVHTVGRDAHGAPL